MYLSAEKMAVVNRAVVETFEHTCIAWQVIPHWDTGDPGQSRVRDDVVDNPGFLNLDLESVDFEVTLVQTSAPTCDSLIAEVNWAATELARLVDLSVLARLGFAAYVNKTISIDFLASSSPQEALLNSLIDARAYVEDSGYRASSALITNTQGLKALSALNAGYPIVEALLDTAHVNSLHRTSRYDLDAEAVDKYGKPKMDGGKPVTRPATLMVMLGRRQLIPYCGAPDASPGEEPVDLAVSVLPSLEVVGETKASQLALSVRVRFALRIKDPTALVFLYGTPVVW